MKYQQVLHLVYIPLDNSNQLYILVHEYNYLHIDVPTLNLTALPLPKSVKIRCKMYRKKMPYGEGPTFVF